MINYRFKLGQNKKLICFKTEERIKKHKGKDALKQLEKIKEFNFTSFNPTIERNRLGKIVCDIVLQSDEHTVKFEDIFSYNNSEALSIIKDAILKIKLNNISKKKEKLLNRKKDLVRLAVATSVLTTLLSAKEVIRNNFMKVESIESYEEDFDIDETVTPKNIESKKEVSHYYKPTVIENNDNIVFTSYKIAKQETISINNIRKTEKDVAKNVETKVEEPKTISNNVIYNYENIEPVFEDIKPNFEIQPNIEEEPVFENIQPTDIAYEEVITTEYTEVEEPQFEYAINNDNEWNGPVLTSSLGRITGPTGGDETYYDLDMAKVVQGMRNKGFSEEQYPYWIREDGCKMLGNYVIVAANLNVHPRGSLVETSLGTGLVCDTGEFAKTNVNQLDIATNWTKHRSK